MEENNFEEQNKEELAPKQELSEKDAQESEADEQYLSESTEENWEDPFKQGELSDFKKYVIHISKEFVDKFDELDVDERNEIVNDALKLKASLEAKDAKMFYVQRLLRHFIIAILTLAISIPFLFWFIDKSIVATVQNYGYVQKNFEKLYKERIDRQRSIQKIQSMQLGL